LDQLNQPFGKDSLSQSVTIIAVFCHVLCFVLGSGFLPAPTLEALESASQLAAQSYSDLLSRHALVDFSHLRDPIPQDMPSALMIPVYSTRFTALLLHYDLSVPAAVRWLGGTPSHTGAHRNHDMILLTLANAGVDADILRDLHHIYFLGSPAYINAESTEFPLQESQNHPWGSPQNEEGGV
jgi:hypothetical protein